MLLQVLPSRKTEASCTDESLRHVSMITFDSNRRKESMLCRMEDGCAHPGEQANKNEESSILSCSGYDGSGDIDDQTSEAQCPSEAVTVPVSEGLESHAARPDDSSVAAQAEMRSEER